MSRQKSALGAFFDAITYMVIEYMKTFVREVFLLWMQIVNIVVNLLLHVFFSPGHYEQTSVYVPPAMHGGDSGSPMRPSDRCGNKLAQELARTLGRTTTTGGRRSGEEAVGVRECTASDVEGSGGEAVGVERSTGNDVERSGKIGTGVSSSSSSSPLQLTSCDRQYVQANGSPALQCVRQEEEQQLQKVQQKEKQLRCNLQETERQQEEKPHCNLEQQQEQLECNSEQQQKQHPDFHQHQHYQESPKRHLLVQLFIRLFKCCWLGPSLFFRSTTSKTTPYHTHDNWSLAQTRTTGLLEDLLQAALLFLDHVGKCMRLLARCYVGHALRSFIRALKLFRPSQFLLKEGIDQRSMRLVVIDDGYPYKRYRVETQDGYYLRLDRLPNPKSRLVLYCQHGILDSGFCWIASGPDLSIAYRCYDTLNCDVFMGNFRGFGPSLAMKEATDRKHQMNAQNQDYWDYSINELAFYDCRAFIEKIVEIKRKELGDDNFEIVAVAHSMGAGATLAYIVHSRLHNIPHRLSKAILLSPAGNHLRFPRLLTILGRIFEPLWDYFPMRLFRYIGLTTKTTKIIAAKIIQDINNHPATRSLLAAILSHTILGGETKKNPLQYIHNLVYHSVNGTSMKVIKHFLQMQRASNFQAFDYGEKKNLQIYGSKTPINFLDNYDKIDIPIHIIYGSDDRVIPAECILKHYTALQHTVPHLVHLKRFDNVGHLDVVYVNDENIIQYVMSSIV